MICTASRLQGMQQFDTTYGRACPEIESPRGRLRRTQSGNRPELIAVIEGHRGLVTLT